MDKKGEKDKKSNMKMMTPFDYKTKGIMAVIGKRNGVGILFGYKVHGFVAWWIWRSYYLSNLPTVQKKLRVMVDWSIDLFFKRDITRIRNFHRREAFLNEASVKETILIYRDRGTPPYMPTYNTAAMLALKVNKQVLIYCERNISVFGNNKGPSIPKVDTY